MNAGNSFQKERLQTAWSLLPESRRAAILPLIEAAHQHLETFQITGKAPPPNPVISHNLLLVKTALTGDQDGGAAALPETEPLADVDAGGAIWGTGRYQQLDPGWIAAAAAWFEHLILGNYPFPEGVPPITNIPDRITLALAGDFGTGDWGTAAAPAPSTKIGQAIPRLAPNLTIHLGDVYYEGSSSEELNNLINVWPSGTAPTTSYTMNSNHEMYSGAKSFFVEALGNPLFAAQNPYSFFALENASWIIVGLDSAYYSDPLTLYMNGSLGTGVQRDFLKQQAQKGKKIILLTHHNGLSDDGSSHTGLWNEVMSCFPAGSGPAYWYWGHVHAGAVYQPQNGVHCRCSGHSALPWGYASGLANSNVAWFETRNAGDPDNSLRVLNGFTFLQLDGASLNETFYDENGGIAWSSIQAAPAVAGE